MVGAKGCDSFRLCKYIDMQGFEVFSFMTKEWCASIYTYIHTFLAKTIT